MNAKVVVERAVLWRDARARYLAAHAAAEEAWKRSNEEGLHADQRASMCFDRLQDCEEALVRSVSARS